MRRKKAEGKTGQSRMAGYICDTRRSIRGTGVAAFARAPGGGHAGFVGVLPRVCRQQHGLAGRDAAAAEVRVVAAVAWGESGRTCRAATSAKSHPGRSCRGLNVFNSVNTRAAAEVHTQRCTRRGAHVVAVFREIVKWYVRAPRLEALASRKEKLRTQRATPCVHAACDEQPRHSATARLLGPRGPRSTASGGKAPAGP